MSRRLLALPLVALAMVLGFLSLDGLRPPPVVPAQAPAEVFSAERAMAHVEAIAQAPRPMGSDEHLRVRRYLEGQLEALGMEVDVETATVIRPGRGPIRGGRVSNVVGRWPATRRDATGRDATAGAAGSVRLVTHYDTVATSPGAADSAAGLAAILETVRALSGDPRSVEDRSRDLVVVFTDGEESGRLGARAHVEAHPGQPGDVVLNFEARGVRGPSLMFETSGAPRPLLARFFRTVDEPRAWSYSDAVYEWMPNRTDFTVFEGAGYEGLNFAFIGGDGAYHSALDTPDRLDPRSLQHHGDQALALARALLAEPAEDPEAPEEDSADEGERRTSAHHAGGAVYFDLLGGLLGLRVAFPEALLPPMVVILVALVPVLLIFEGSRRRSRVKRVLGRSLLVAAGAVLLAVVLSYVAPWIVGGPETAAEQIVAGISRLGVLTLGAGVLALAVAVGLWRFVGRGGSSPAAHAPGYGVPGLAGLRTTPGGDEQHSPGHRPGSGSPVDTGGLVELDDGHPGPGRLPSMDALDGWLTGAGGLVVWALLTLAVSVAAPGAAYLVAVPLLLALVTGAAQLASRRPAVGAALSAMTLAILVALWVPTAYLTLVALGAGAVPALAAVGFLLLVGPLRSTLEPLAMLGRWLTPSCGIVGLALVVLAGVLPAEGGIVRGDHLFYSLDTSAPADDPDRALWVSHDAAPSPWTATALGEQPRRDTQPSFLGPPRPVLLAQAPVLPIAGGAVELEQIERRGEGRRLQLRLSWPEPQHRVTVFVRTDSEVARLAVDGQKIEHLMTLGPGDEATRLLLFFEAPPTAGLPLTIDVVGNHPVTVDAVAQRYALPAPAHGLLGPRPEGLRPAASWTTDSTYVRTVAVIDSVVIEPEAWHE